MQAVFICIIFCVILVVCATDTAQTMLLFRFSFVLNSCMSMLRIMALTNSLPKISLFIFKQAKFFTFLYLLVLFFKNRLELRFERIYLRTCFSLVELNCFDFFLFNQIVSTSLFLLQLKLVPLKFCIFFCAEINSGYLFSNCR